MSLIPVILNLLLAVLLLAALIVGWRLEKRLKELRQSHLGFAKAVQELDMAALRAQAGLDQLRTTAEEAGDLLGDRLVRARDMSEKLQILISAADKVADKRRHEPEPPRSRLRNDLDTLQLSPADRVPASPASRKRSSIPSMDDDLFTGPDDPAPEPPAPRQPRRNLFGGRR